MAEPSEMQFGLWNSCEPRHHVGLLAEGPDLLAKGQFSRGRAVYCKV